jgi:hypothetical protein
LRGTKITKITEVEKHGHSSICNLGYGKMNRPPFTSVNVLNDNVELFETMPIEVRLQSLNVHSSTQ